MVRQRLRPEGGERGFRLLVIEEFEGLVLSEGFVLLEGLVLLERVLRLQEGRLRRQEKGRLTDGGMMPHASRSALFPE